MELQKTLLAGVGVFAIFAVAVYLILAGFDRLKQKHKKKKKQTAAEGAGAASKNMTGFRIRKMDVILALIALVLVLFTLRMIELFEIYGATPDVLITCVFAVCGGECGAMSWIKTSEDKYRDRRWHLEDVKKAETPSAAATDMPRNDL